MAYYLEGRKWGARYPNFMKKMYAGKLSPADAVATIKELEDIQKNLLSWTKILILLYGILEI